MTRYVWDDEAETWVHPWEAKVKPVARSDIAAPMVMSDIGDYQSVIDRSVITSRSHHREHLKRNDCVEVGNEWVPPKRHALAPADRVNDIKQSIEKHNG